jgi:hypothetical protein
MAKSVIPSVKDGCPFLKVKSDKGEHRIPVTTIEVAQIQKACGAEETERARRRIVARYFEPGQRLSFA